MGAVLLNMAVFGAVLAYILQMVSFILLRMRFPRMERPYVSPMGIGGRGGRGADRSGHAGRRCSCNPDYNKGVIGAAVWFLLRHRLLRRRMRGTSWCWRPKRNRRYALTDA